MDFCYDKILLTTVGLKGVHDQIATQEKIRQKPPIKPTIFKLSGNISEHVIQLFPWSFYFISSPLHSKKNLKI